MKIISLILLTFSVVLFGFRQEQAPAGNDQRSLLKKIYTAELGVREATGRNDGNKVEAYLRYVGLKKGQPWCASYVCWCLGQAGIPNPRRGYCPDLFPAGRVIWVRKLRVESSGLKAESGKVKAESKKAAFKAQALARTPEPGDIFGLYFPEKGRIAHVGFVDEWGDKYVVTVEGNTNEAGSREGDGVYRKRRLISSIYKVASFVPSG